MSHNEIRIQPEFSKDGIPECTSQCPSHDGKRCYILGCRPDQVCRPAVEIMAEALKECSHTFKHYATVHLAKGTPEARAKAKGNEKMARMCDDALGVKP